MTPRLKQYIILISSFILLGFSLYIRGRYISWASGDMTTFLIGWYNKLAQKGILNMLGRDFSNYTPPYLYLMALSTFTSGFLPKVAAIKLISIFFDVYAACIVFRIVRLRYPNGFIPYLAGAVYFSMPTIIINSSIWGQADSIYTAFLITCVYFLLVDRPFYGILFFAFAFAFKLQAVFLAPFLLALTLQKKIPWYYYLLIPVIYIILVTPTVFLGRSWEEALTIYLSQTSNGKALSRNAANLYIFISRDLYPMLIKPSLAVASLIILVWVAFTWRFIKKIDAKIILLLALISVGLTPFVLPKMHDRYFYPADALSIALGFWIPELWFIPICYQLISGLSYIPFLADRPVIYVEIGAIINLITLTFLLWKQFSLIKLQGDEILPVNESADRAQPMPQITMKDPEQ